ncbi:hypothetical protein KKG22_00205 [Patescibacteria group bacterium]|nr:hypothetical protein [Patescibacteria group bacterium]MBU1900850.1 hypothetical protein [Patescibacteria group bacterium]
MNQKKNNVKVSLWRDRPILSFSDKQIMKKNVFPSGRQALTAALCHMGLDRSSRVAVPEWSSHCVLSAIAKVATPIPIKEVVNCSISVDSILLYSQWGWTPNIDWTEYHSIFGDIPVICDEVDSAHMLDESMPYIQAHYEVRSLSKTLGLKSGGLLKYNGKYVEFTSDKNHKNLDITGFTDVNTIVRNTFLKAEKIYLDEEVDIWLDNNDVSAALLHESRLRRCNVKNIIDSHLASTWKEWMIQSFNRGIAPGLVPLYIGYDRNDLLKIKSELARTFNIETSIYHFNISECPWVVDYKQCLAFPVHGLNNKVEEIIQFLKYE